MSDTKNVPTGNPISDKDLISKIQGEHKQVEVKRSKFPTEYVPLPSKGKLYPEGHPLHEGVIECKYMTSREEDILTSPNLIKSGKVFDELFKSLIITPVNYNDIYLGDRNAIMVAARILGYGKDYTVEVVDPFVTDEEIKQKVTVDLAELKHKEVNLNEYDQTGVNRFPFILPKTGRAIEFQLLTVGMEQQIKEETKINNQKSKGIDREYTTRLKKMIVSVDGNEDRNDINTFVDEELFSADSMELRRYINLLSPDIDMTFTFISNATGESKEMQLPMEVSFFWPTINA